MWSCTARSARPDSNLDPNEAFDKLGTHLVGRPSRRYRSYPNKCWLRRQGVHDCDRMTTKTIIREHEADLVIQDAQAVADDVVALTLADPRGAELPAWTPGAYIDLILGDDLTRQYLLCSSPSNPDVWRLGVLRAPDSRVARSGCTAR